MDQIRNLKFELLSVAVAIFAIIALFIWRSEIPYPNIADWDIFAHQTLFNEMGKGKISPFPPKISDTFLITSYLPTFALSLGAVEKILPSLSFAKIYFLLDTAHFLVTVALSAYLGWIATRRKMGALIAGSLGAFIFESTIVQTSLFFTPQSTAAVLGVLGIAILVNRKKWAFAPLGLSILFHFLIGAGAVILGSLVILFQKLLEKPKGRLVVFSLGFTALILGVLTNFIPLNIDPLQTIESQEFKFPLLQKLTLLQNWYGYLWLFYPVGIWAAFRKKNPKLDIILAISWSALAGVAIFAPYSLKLYTLARFLVHAVGAAGALYLLENLKPILRYALLTILVSTQIIIFSVNQKNFKEAFSYEETFTSASQEEIDAGDFLRRYYGGREDVLLVSDPATQHVLEALSTVNTQGGAFAHPQTRIAVDDTFPQDNPRQVQELLGSIKDGLSDEYPQTILFAVSGRFLVWQNLPDELRLDETYLIWGPKDLTPQGEDYIDLLTKGGFKKIFQNKGVSILEVER